MFKGRDQIQQAYRDDNVARQYVAERFTSPLGALLHDRQVKAVTDLIHRHGIRQAVEIAPGPARLTVDIADHLERVTLLDASAQMLHEARRRLETRRLLERARFVQADAFALPVIANLELVYTFRLIRHFQADDRIKILSQIAGILRPGGRVVFDVVNETVSTALRAKAGAGEYEHYDALLRPETVRDEARQAGLELESLIGVQHRYPTLHRIQVLVAPRSASLARAAMEILDRTGGEPLEWVAICRRA